MTIGVPGSPSRHFEEAARETCPRPKKRPKPYDQAMMTGSFTKGRRHLSRDVPRRPLRLPHKNIARDAVDTDDLTDEAKLSDNTRGPSEERSSNLLASGSEKHRLRSVAWGTILTGRYRFCPLCEHVPYHPPLTSIFLTRIRNRSRDLDPDQVRYGEKKEQGTTLFVSYEPVGEIGDGTALYRDVVRPSEMPGCSPPNLVRLPRRTAKVTTARHV